MNLVEIVNNYSEKNNIQVFVDIKMGDNSSLEVDIDQGFIDMFESTYPSENLDELISELFSELISKYTKDLQEE